MNVDQIRVIGPHPAERFLEHFLGLGPGIGPHLGGDEEPVAAGRHELAEDFLGVPVM
jgi:hypothetical protein